MENKTEYKERVTYHYYGMDNLDGLMKDIKEGKLITIVCDGTTAIRPLVDKFYDELPQEQINNISFNISYDLEDEASMSPELFEHLDDLISDDAVTLKPDKSNIMHCLKLIEDFIEQGTLCKYYIEAKDSSSATVASNTVAQKGMPDVFVIFNESEE